MIEDDKCYRKKMYKISKSGKQGRGLFAFLIFRSEYGDI
jgi:hypothetical protein